MILVYKTNKNTIAEWCTVSPYRRRRHRRRHSHPGNIAAITVDVALHPLSPTRASHDRLLK
jgi:hypothetical protein